MKLFSFEMLRRAAFCTIGVLALAAFSYGSGAEAATSTISTCSQLEAIPASTTGTYALVNDIDCSADIDFSSISDFRGVFDGSNYTIDRLNFIGGNYRGLFSDATSATIRNVRLANVALHTNFQQGPLASSVNDSFISNVSASGTFSSSAALSNAGGLIGVANSSTLEYVSARFTSTGFSYIGGLVGILTGTSTLRQSYAVGTITSIGSGGTSMVGGLVGQNVNSSIEDAYAQVNITALEDYAGGLVARNEGTGSINRSYAAGTFSGLGSDNGGLVGAQDVTATTADSYWDTTVSSQLTSAGGTGRTTVQMQDELTFVGWDFGTVWLSSVSAYPTLRAHDITPPSAPSAFSASALGSSALLSWTNPADGDFSSVTLRRSTSAYPTSINGGTAVTSSVVVTSFMDGSLADGRYYYSIFARDTNGNVSAAATTTVLIDTTAPSAPGVPSGTSPTADTTPTVSWSASSDAGSGLAGTPYFVQWSQSSGFSGTIYAAQSGTTSFTPTSTLAEGSWYFRVRAIDVSENASAYSTSAALVIDLTAPTVTVNGNSTPTIIQNQPYSEVGASASDAVSGNLTSSIIQTGSVNTSVPGSYTLTYTATDTAGNSGSALRIVQVLAAGGGGGGAQAVRPTSLGINGGTIGTLNVLVNGSDAGTTTSRSPAVTLTFNADPQTVRGYATSLRPDFLNASIYPYTSSIQFSLPSEPGTYTIYTKFYSTTGDASPVIARTVAVNAGMSATPPSVNPSPSTSPNSPSTPATVGRFTRNLRRGMSGSDVRVLQMFLNRAGFRVAANGAGSPGNESTYFGSATANALIRLQEAHSAEILRPMGLVRGTGLLLEATRRWINEQL